MADNNKILMCKMTYCVHNNSCCGSPNKGKEKELYCTLVKQGKEVELKKDRCNMMEWDENKKVRCIDCQIEKTGVIDVNYLDQKLFKKSNNK